MSLYSSLLVGARLRVERRFSAARGSSGSGRPGRRTRRCSASCSASCSRSRRGPTTPRTRCGRPGRCRARPGPRGFRGRFGLERIVTSYGSTEIGMVTRRIVASGADVSAGRVDRRPLRGRVVDEYDEEVPAGEVGELIVRPRCRGRRRSATSGMPDAAFAASRNLWFHTGDAVRLDAEGNLTFVDRFATASGAAARTSRRPTSRPCCRAPGRRRGRRRRGARRRGGRRGRDQGGAWCGAGAALDAESVWAWCDERLPYFAVPRYVELAPELPKTPTSKVRKNELRAAGVRRRDRRPRGGGARRGRR